MFQTLHEISKNLIFVFVWKYVWKYVNINVSDTKKKRKKKKKRTITYIWPRDRTVHSPNWNSLSSAGENL